jgi:uncharacterized protein
MAGAPTLVFVAGIGNSEEDHWQRHWHREVPGSVWVEHASWDEPDCSAWIADLRETLACVRGPKLLVVHSLGCLLTAAWAAAHSDPEVEGGFLVSVPDPEGPSFPTRAKGFGAGLSSVLPMRSLVVASETDPYGSIGYARSTAEAWGADFVSVGCRGHINLASGLGRWDEGWSLLRGHFLDR